MSDTDQQTAVCNPPATRKIEKPRVLVGDNDHKFRSRLVEMLEGAYNVEVEHVDSAKKLAERARSGDFVVIITDGIYEGVAYDGMATIGELRAERNMTPMVMLTSCDSPDVKANIERYRLAHVVLKGDNEGLTTILNNYLSGHRRR